MPGHKGQAAFGPEAFDITEIEGADELYPARGIIRESEANAAVLFGAGRTLYSAEGSSLCIRAMLYLAALTAGGKGVPQRLLAGRNAHKTLMTAAALLDLESATIRNEMAELEKQGYLEQPHTSAGRVPSNKAYRLYVDHLLKTVKLTQDERERMHEHLVDKSKRVEGVIRSAADVVKAVALGADACCDSAHKTLSCLTGAAYLHIAPGAPEGWAEQAEQAMALFASTSPSWLILQSLDRMNPELAGGYPARLREAARRTAETKKILADEGWTTIGDEPMKITLDAAAAGYTGRELAQLLRRDGIECEFADREFLVLMPSAETTEAEFGRVEAALRRIPQRDAAAACAPPLPIPERVMRIREAMLSPSREVPVEEAVGQVMADASAGCPPAVPTVIAGERITADAAACLRYYGFETCRIVIHP